MLQAREKNSWDKLVSNVLKRFEGLIVNRVYYQLNESKRDKSFYQVLYFVKNYRAFGKNTKNTYLILCMRDKIY